MNIHYIILILFLALFETTINVRGYTFYLLRTDKPKGWGNGFSIFELDAPYGAWNRCLLSFKYNRTIIFGNINRAILIDFLFLNWQINFPKIPLNKKTDSYYPSGTCEHVGFITIFKDNYGDHRCMECKKKLKNNE